MKLIKSNIQLTRKQKIRVLWMNYNAFYLTKRLYWKVIPYDYRPREIYYRLKCFFWKRYTTVKGRFLPHTYMDAECILIHSMFEIVCNFVEKEMEYVPGPKFSEWLEWQRTHNSHRTVNVNGEIRFFYDEILEIYHWWLANHERPYNKEISKLLEKHNKDGLDTITGWNDRWGGPLYEWEDEWDSEDSENKYEELRLQEREDQANYDTKLDEMLHRIVNLRSQLWS